MAPDQCIFVSATYDMTYEKEVIFGSQIYPGGGICSTLLSIKIRNHYHKYKKRHSHNDMLPVLYSLLLPSGNLTYRSGTSAISS